MYIRERLGLGKKDNGEKNGVKKPKYHEHLIKC